MPCTAWLALVGVFLVAAIDDSAVFVGRVPYLRSVPTAAAAAFDFVREDAHAAVLAVLLSAFYLRLHKVEQVRRNNRLVMFLHIVLRNLTRILPSRLIEEVRRILFLDQRIATILLVGEDGAHCGNVPLVLSRWGFEAALLQFLGNRIEGSPAKEEFVDELHHFRLFLVDFEVLVIAEKRAVAHTGFALGVLYRVHPASTTKYLAETDPAFVVSAGKNIALAGATLAALDKNDSVLLSAGENISLDTKKLQSEKDMTVSTENYRCSKSCYSCSGSRWSHYGNTRSNNRWTGKQNLADDLSRFSAGTSGKNANDSVDKILEKAIPRPPKRRAEQYDKTGGYDQAEKDFNSLDLEEGSVKDRTDKEGKKKIGVLRDGRKVNVREKSSEGHPTLEIIQPNKNKTRIKIRYSD